MKTDAAAFWWNPAMLPDWLIDYNYSRKIRLCSGHLGKGGTRSLAVSFQLMSLSADMIGSTMTFCDVVSEDARSSRGGE